jgi:hypothetical protein
MRFNSPDPIDPRTRANVMRFIRSLRRLSPGRRDDALLLLVARLDKKTVDKLSRIALSYR